MLIGQYRAGKTSLKRSLLGLPFDPNEQSTDGIEIIHPWKFETDVDQVKNWQRTDENLGMNLQSDDRSTEHHITLDLWDFAGQHLYYASYPVFLSSRAVYVLVYNLSKRLNETAMPSYRDGNVHPTLKNPTGETNLENLLSWLVSVSTMSSPKPAVDESKETKKGLSYLRPLVFIVGTHADKPVEDINTMKQQILEEISGKDYACHVMRPIFAIDNTQGSSSDGIRELQKRLIEVLKEEPYMGEEVPVRWFNFEKVVEDLVAKNIYYLNLEQLKTIIQKHCFIDNEDEVFLMLNFYHDLGKIVKHRSTVVLRSEWLIGIFKQLLTHVPFTKLKHLPFRLELMNRGVLRKELVDDVFAESCPQGEIKEDILNMMEQFGLIVKFESSLGDHYFVPSLLRSQPEQLWRMEPPASDPCPLYIHFSGGFVPHGLYSQLVSRCSSWCTMRGFKQPPNLFSGASAFFIEKEVIHVLILICGKQLIKVILTKMKSDIDASLAEREEVTCLVRIFLEETLEDLSFEFPWLHNLEFELCASCPYCQKEQDACHNHGQTSCIHEDCLCLLKVLREGELMYCRKSVSHKVLTLPGLEKWFPVEVPSEIRAQGPRAQLAYVNALKNGKVKVYRARIMLIGQDRAGKTSLKKSFLGLPFDPNEQSTDGIEIDPSKFEIDVDNVKNWRRTDEKVGVSQFADDLARMVAEKLDEKKNVRDESKEGRFQKHQPGLLAAEDLEEEIKTDQRPQDEPQEVRPKINQVPFREENTEETQETGSGRHEGIHDGNATEEPVKLELTIDPLLPPDEFEHLLCQHLKGLNLQSDVTSTEHHITLDLWDFAGQHLYYASYPVFLSPRAVYMLVYNLSKRLNETAKPSVRHGNVDTPLTNSNGETNLENLLSWLVSVSTMSSPKPAVDGSKETKEGLSYVRPPVFIVGTHADKPVENIDRMEKQIKQEISGKDYACHVIRPVFSIDNTQGSSGDGILALQERMIEVLKEEPYMGEELPVRWFHFEKVVEELVAKKMYYLNLEQLKAIIQKYCFINNEDEVKLMLDFYHDLGKIVKHGSTVVLRAEWLIDLFKQLITFRSFEDMDPKHEPFWKEMRDTGVLRKELVDDVFGKFCQQGAIKEDILSMMEQFGLIVKFESSLGVHYFVPSQLSSPRQSLCRVEPSPSDPCPLYLHFPGGFVPHGLYSQLVSRCAKWCSGSKQKPVFRDMACSFIAREGTHRFILFCKKRFITIVLKQTNQEDAASSAEIAEVPNDLLWFVEDTLQTFKRELPWLRNLEYEFCVECPCCPEDKNICRNHGQVSCSHEDCMCVLRVQLGGQLSCCPHSGEIPQLPSLKRWFSTKGTKRGLPSPVPQVSKRIKRVDDKGTKRGWLSPIPQVSKWIKRVDDRVQRMLRELQQMQYEAGTMNSKASLFVQLEKIASDKGFTISDNEGSGNCMFHALSEQLNLVKGIQISHAELRQRIVQYLKENPTLPDGTELFNFVDGHSSWSDYLRNMEADSMWGDHVILHAAANCFKTCIHVITSLSVHHDVTICPDQDLDSSNSNSRLMLGHVHEHHYVSLRPKPGKEGCPAYDELEELSRKIEFWKPLGRRLKFTDAELTAFHKDNVEWSETAYAMLKAWKEREGSAGSYCVLYGALCHSLVGKRDLAEELCCYHG